MFEVYSLKTNRKIVPATTDNDALGPLRLLPGTWANIRPEHQGETPFAGDGTLTGQGQSPFDGRGWNLIALPFAEAGQFRNYRLLMNQYNEVLKFAKVDDNVPNRGITKNRPAEEADQKIAALDYEQVITQISAMDMSPSGLAGDPEVPIHHEPGFFLHMREQQIEGIDIARLATIPHGNSATALGKSRVFDGPPTIGDLSGFPEGIATDIDAAVAAATGATDYLFPYHHFQTVAPFKGVLEGTPFPGFLPGQANALLSLGMPANVVRTTELSMDTDVMEAGIVNIPFVERQADAASMKSTFWIMELDEVDAAGNQRLVMAYSQFIYLDFFARRDGKPGPIRWPHVSINMMEKIIEPEHSNVEELLLSAAPADR